MDIEQLRRQVASGEKLLRITTHAQTHAYGNGMFAGGEEGRRMRCGTCGADMVRDGVAAEVYWKGQMIISVAGIPAVAICPRCNNAILEWDVAQQVEDLVQPLLKWPEEHALPSPMITITFAPPLLKAA